MSHPASRRVLLASALVLPLAIVASPASAELMTYYVKNLQERAIVLELRSRNRDKIWPGGGKVFLIDPQAKKSLPIECDPGEQICYGAWLNGSDSVVWGVGPDDDRPCEDCCRICVEKTTEIIELTP